MSESNTSPVVPARASTVILIRDTNGQLQVYLLKRSSQSGFMPGNYVFPGGVVDPEDRNVDFWSGYVDLDRDQVIKRFGGVLNNADVVSHGIAAIRETFEEAGILLARQNGGTGRDLDNLRDRRLVGSLRKTWLRELVASGEWTLRFSELAPWSHWITPKARSKRYDTRFFMACMPEGQECRPDNRETTYGIWASPFPGSGTARESGDRLTPDNPRDHHVVVGADRYRVLVRTTCKCSNILSYLRKGDDFVNITPFGAVYGS